LEEGEYLEYDPTAYDLIHFMRVEAPCLSFDILTDTLGYERKRVRELDVLFPLLSYVVEMPIPDEHRTDQIVMYSAAPHSLCRRRFSGP